MASPTRIFWIFQRSAAQYLRTVIKQQIYREIDGIPDYIRDIMVDFYAEPL